jgi:hypothetical protein
MIKLIDIHTNFQTDKGTAHSYVSFYDNLFEPIKTKKLNILEIGVLFGGSLKMWEYYFLNSQIFGIEDFSQKTGQNYYNNKLVDPLLVFEDLKSHDRIKLYNLNCEDKQSVNHILENKIFDIIIDDASHEPSQQLNNLELFLPKVNKEGFYICEDIRSDAIGKNLIAKVNEIDKNLKCSLYSWDKKRDDRLLLVRV